MNNMRRGFTLIELIFVIVIIGILAAVALPRFLDTADQAHVSKIKAYAGTLSRTTLPPFWSKSMESGLSGVVTSYDATIRTSLVYPQELTTFNGFGGLTAGVLTVGSSTAVAAATIGGTTYTVRCVDGSLTDSPKCNVDDGNNFLITY